MSERRVCCKLQSANFPAAKPAPRGKQAVCKRALADMSSVNFFANSMSRLWNFGVIVQDSKLVPLRLGKTVAAQRIFVKISICLACLPFKSKFLIFLQFISVQVVQQTIQIKKFRFERQTAYTFQVWSY